MIEVKVFAKSRGLFGGTPPSVAEHCRDVLTSAQAIWSQLEGPLADAVAADRATLRKRLQPLLFAAAVLHDVLKANSSFQDILRSSSDYKTQPVRHEILAAIVLSQHESISAWLKSAFNDRQFWSLIWAIGGHHFQLRLKREFEATDPLFRVRNVPKSVTLYLGHSQVQNVLDEVYGIAHSVNIDMEPVPRDVHDSPPLDPLDDSPDGLERSVMRLLRESDREWKKWKRNADGRSNLLDLALLKILLVASDIAGSALPGSAEVDLTPEKWIASALSQKLTLPDLQKVIDDNLKGRLPHKFQQNVADSEKLVTIVSAGCGNGKTTAAYMWAKKHAVGRKLFFTYPTTGTASAGFQDYLFAQTNLERELIHGRAGVDLQMMWESTDIPPVERAQRLDSLNAWGQQVIACTVDTVLGLIQNQRRPVFSFPAIIRGAFVFDEVHSYDRRLFAALLRFLDTFPGIPVLIMSASIPPERLAELKRVAGDRANDKPIPGDEKMEAVQRYRLHKANEDGCWKEVESLLHANDQQNGNKVLWVCNTVGHAMAAYKEAKQRFPFAEVLLYHSRYRYGDRVSLQGALIEEFRYADDAKSVRQHHGPAIAITTQVCEMSLDISADLLVSAMCPLPSLVQRLGRLNRYAKTNNPCPAFCYSFSGRPYHEHDDPAYMLAAERMVEELAGKPCSQATLNTYINQLQGNEELPQYSAWLDGGWQSEPMPLREGDNSITLVRQEDLKLLKRLPNGNYNKNDVIPLTIPMLYQDKFDFSARAAGYPIAPAGSVEYDWDGSRGEGASWPRK